ncbi:MAG: alpha-mannosidase, partial [Actinomycetota bacterium]|nr:alpha-mannosidase [Actinomycetota bacterium]
AATHIAGAVPRGAVAVLNPSPHARTDVVVLDVAVPAEWSDVALRSPDGSDLATQELSRSEPLLFTRELSAAEVPRMFSRVHGRELFGRCLNGCTVDDADGRPRLTFTVGNDPDPVWLDVTELRREVELAARAASAETWDVRVVAAPRRVLAAAVPAPPLGWSAVRPVSGRGIVADRVDVSGGAMRNGLLDVEVEPAGTLRVRAGGVDLSGVGRLVDGGDAGDTYNYAPPAVNKLVEAPEDVRVETRAAGPVAGRLHIVRTYAWPRATDQKSRGAETATVEVETEVELRAGEPFLRFRFSFENPCSDHRLRAHIPLAVRAEGSAAEGQFAVVERRLEAEGGAGEVALPTFPARGFVDAGGVAVLLQHVLEYEVLEGTELALTILRATGLISRNTNSFRAEPAGPEIAVPGAQGRGPRSVAFALLPHAGSWSEARVLTQMERYAHPFVTVSGAGEGDALEAASGLELQGDGVVLSSLRRRGDGLEVRLVCESPQATTATLRGAFSDVREVDLLGRATGRAMTVRDRLILELAPWEIRTLQLKR